MPGDKSISHRALLIASMIPGENLINNISTGQDVENTLQCLNSIGIKSDKNNNTLSIQGGNFIIPKKRLFCGNSGTTLRLLSGLLVGLNIKAELYGDESLLIRPMDRIINPLLNMGANIKGDNNYAPIAINPVASLKDLEYNMTIASAQVKSALLLGHARGVPMLCASSKSMPVFEYSARKIKQSVTGNGNADKSQVKYMIMKEFNLKTFNFPDDASDALAGALCHLNQTKLDEL